MMKRLDAAIVRFVASDSVDFLTNDTSRYNLIFLDGDHSAASVYRELPLALQRLADGGIIFSTTTSQTFDPLAGENATEGDLQTQVLRGCSLPFSGCLMKELNPHYSDGSFAMANKTGLKCH